MDTQERRRGTDGGFLCRVAVRASQLWDFIDRRDIDKHFVAAVVFIGAIPVQLWAQRYAHEALAAAVLAKHTVAPVSDAMGEAAAALSGQGAGSDLLGVAAVIAAVIGPYMGMAAYVLKWYLRVRPSGDEEK